MSYHIFHDLQINKSCEEVFEAISQPEELINWWPKRCSGTPELGSNYNFFFGTEYNWFGEVMAIEKPHFFAIKMTSSDKDWNPTSFGFDLEEIAEGTLLKFWHKNWPHCNAHYRRSSYCWAILLRGLKDYLEHNTIIPFEERA